MISNRIDHIQNRCDTSTTNTIVDTNCIHKERNVTVETEIKKPKKNNKQYVMPTSNNYDILKTNKYRIVDLKNIAKKYNLKVSGTKPILLHRIYQYLSTYKCATRIQSIVRGNIVRTFMKLHGPLLTNNILSKCVNDVDFITLDDIKTLPYSQVYIYKDEKDFYYAFDICSLYNLFKMQTPTLNPYTRDILPERIYTDIQRIVKLGNIVNIPIDLNIEDTNDQFIDPEAKFRSRIINVFSAMDDLGNYTNSDWLLNLNRSTLVKFMMELKDIWIYRAQIEQRVKMEICPPHGSLFGNIDIRHLLRSNERHVKDVVSTILERIVYNGIHEQARSLGSLYVLTALTLVNNEAANAMPWLFNSVI